MEDLWDVPGIDQGRFNFITGNAEVMVARSRRKLAHRAMESKTDDAGHHIPHTSQKGKKRTADRSKAK